ncbi:unnamed protein product, partial [Prorocentrum cordatum]
VAMASLEKMGERLGRSELTRQYVGPIRQHPVPKVVAQATADAQADSVFGDLEALPPDERECNIQAAMGEDEGGGEAEEVEAKKARLDTAGQNIYKQLKQVQGRLGKHKGRQRLQCRLPGATDLLQLCPVEFCPFKINMILPAWEEHADLVLVGGNADSWNSFALVVDWLADEAKVGKLESFGLTASSPWPHLTFVQETRINAAKRATSAETWSRDRHMQLTLGVTSSTGPGATESTSGMGVLVNE